MKTITLNEEQVSALMQILNLADKTQNGLALAFDQQMRDLEAVLKLPVEELKRLGEEGHYLPGLEDQHLQWCECGEVAEAICDNQIRFGEISQLLIAAPRFEYVASK